MHEALKYLQPRDGAVSAWLHMNGAPGHACLCADRGFALKLELERVSELMLCCSQVLSAASW